MAQAYKCDICGKFETSSDNHIDNMYAVEREQATGSRRSYYVTIQISFDLGSGTHSQPKQACRECARALAQLIG